MTAETLQERAEHERLHPLNGMACPCLCPECWNPHWGAEMKDPNATVRICLCPECGCGGWH